MKEISNDALYNIKGGFDTNVLVALGIVALVTFLAGIIDGITNPERCNS